MAVMTASSTRTGDAGRSLGGWETRDGRCVSVCALDGSALRRYTDFVQRLSPSSRAFRFLMPINGLSDQAARRLVEPDQCREVAWVASAATAGSAIIAEVRYAVTAPAEAELALAVADDWQRSGLGAYLLLRLLRHAAAAHVAQVWGRVRRDNHSAIALATRCGFRARLDPQEPQLLMLARSTAWESPPLQIRPVPSSPRRRVPGHTELGIHPQEFGGFHRSALAAGSVVYEPSGRLRVT